MHGSCGKCGSGHCCPISKKGVKFGMAFGVSNAIFLLALGWAGWLLGHSTALIEHTATIYHGFGPTFLGGLIGGAWGFVLGFVYGYIFGLVLSCCSRCCGECGSSSCSTSNTTK